MEGWIEMRALGSTLSMGRWKELGEVLTLAVEGDQEIVVQAQDLEVSTRRSE